MRACASVNRMTRLRSVGVMRGSTSLQYNGAVL
jgi:hypothetical protein